MVVTRPRWMVYAVLGLAGLVATCDKTPTGPGTLSGVTPSGPFGLDLTGPPSVPPGQTVQFRAILRESSGTTRDVSTQAQWTAVDSDVLGVSTTGLVTGLERGETFLRASFNGFIGSRMVFVLPDGTFRLTGTVTDAGTGVRDARVEVADGTSRGVATMTDVLGQYRLYGVSGDTLIRASKNGYQSAEHRLLISGNQTLNLVMSVAGRLPAVAGRYTLRVTASDACSSLSDVAKRRTYTAVVTQDGSAVDVKLSGASFLVNVQGRGDGFRGRFEPGELVFSLEPVGNSSGDDYYYYYDQPYPNVIERISNEFLIVAGTARLSVTAGGMSGRLKGSLQLYTQLPPSGLAGKCDDTATGHQFVFSR
jgi:Bacterial Ig-like domain (group 2)